VIGTGKCPCICYQAWSKWKGMVRDTIAFHRPSLMTDTRSRGHMTFRNVIYIVIRHVTSTCGDLQDSTTGASNWLFWFTFWRQKVWTRMWRVLCVLTRMGRVILQIIPIDDGWSWFLGIFPSEALKVSLWWSYWRPMRPGCLSEPLNQLIMVACIQSLVFSLEFW